MTKDFHEKNSALQMEIARLQQQYDDTVNSMSKSDNEANTQILQKMKDLNDARSEVVS